MEYQTHRLDSETRENSNDERAPQKKPEGAAKMRSEIVYEATGFVPFYQNRIHLAATKVMYRLYTVLGKDDYNEPNQPKNENKQKFAEQTKKTSSKEKVVDSPD